MSKIYIEDIWVCDIFKWFCNHIRDSGGDGCSWIVCKNYEECSKWFLEWYKKEYKREMNYKIFKDKNSINLLDDQENFIFTNNIPNGNTFHDYVFIIKKDCYFGFEEKNDSKKIIPLK